MAKGTLDGHICGVRVTTLGDEGDFRATNVAGGAGWSGWVGAHVLPLRIMIKPVSGIMGWRRLLVPL